MPKFPTFPTIYDECKQICLSELKRWGYLNPDQYLSGVITWSRNGNETGSISITVNTINEDHPFIELKYTYGGEPRNYKVHLVSLPSTVMSGYDFYNFHNKKEFRTIHVDKLIKGICKDNKVSEKHIRKIMGLRT